MYIMLTSNKPKLKYYNCIKLTVIYILIQITFSNKISKENIKLADYDNKNKEINYMSLVNDEKQTAFLKLKESLKILLDKEVAFDTKVENIIYDKDTKVHLVNSVDNDRRRYDSKSENIEFYNDFNDYTNNDHIIETPKGSEKDIQNKYKNEWLVYLTGRKDLVKNLAENLGYKYIDTVKGFDFVHRLIRDTSSKFKRRKRSVETQIPNNLQHSDVQAKLFWAEQQYVKKRTKRRPKTLMEGYNDRVEKLLQKEPFYNPDHPHIRVKRKIDENNNTETRNQILFNKMMKRQNLIKNLYNDELWNQQWYLFDSRTSDDLPRLDLHVTNVWKSGITGSGIKVIVLDDGLEHNHTDIVDNYNSDLGYDVNDDDDDPMPRYDANNRNSHGTMCAGEVVMKPNNKKCGVGIAYGATLGAVRMLDGDVSDRVEGIALAFGATHADVVICSWGPIDDGKTLDGPRKLGLMALEMAVEKGRDGKGTTIVWASGNGGSMGDNCNCDGYTSSIYTLSIGSASQSGSFPSYGEECTSTLATVYSSGAHTDQMISTTDLYDKCTTQFAGTSAAAPLAAGIIALTLEVNPSLTWRDIQHLVVWTSEWKPLDHVPGWKDNGKGLKFNSKFGFGIMNAEKMTKAAKNWIAVPAKLSCSFDSNLKSSVQISNEESIEIKFKVKLCDIISLEHVQINITLEHSKRGCLQIDLISPEDTLADVLNSRPNDDSRYGFNDWTFMSVQTWGENPEGVWILHVKDICKSKEIGFLYSVYLTIHGTKKIPAYLQNTS